MSFFKALVDLGRSEMQHTFQFGRNRQTAPYRGRYNRNGTVDQRYDKSPNQAENLNKQSDKK